MAAADHPRIGAVILAAGMSTRMGEPKQLLRLGRSTLLEHALRSVQGASVDETVLVLGFAAGAIQQQLSLDGCSMPKLKIVINRDYQRGMASSLRAGLEALEAGIAAALIVLADQPLVRSSTLIRLMDRYRGLRAPVVIPTYQGIRGNPVLLDRSLFPEAMALTGDSGCRAIFSAHVEQILREPVEDPAILLDIDNKDDLRRLEGFGRSIAHDHALLEALISSRKSEDR